MPTYLVVDNSPTIRAALVQHLKGPGRTVHEADGIASAHKALGEAGVDVLFTGMRLEAQESSLPLIHDALARFPGKPIVLVTSMPKDHPEVTEALAAGCWGIIEKPVRSDAVRRVLQGIDAESGRLRRIR